MIRSSTPPITMTVITDPNYLAEATKRREMFARNVAWIEGHAKEAYSHRGKVICVAGQELFVGDDVEEVVARAQAAHPNDEGIFTKFVPISRAPRIYAN